jgi:hypothetical protein
MTHGVSLRRVTLDPTKVPPSCAPLLPLAEVWGVEDDYERYQLVDRASPEELRALVEAVNGAPDTDLYGWLAGPSARDPNPSDEYVAVTCLTMAADHARLRLRREG